MSEPRKVNGPPGYPLIGHWRQFQRDRLGFLAECYERYGETTRLRIVSPTYLVNNPGDIHHVLVGHEKNYRKSWRITGRAGRRLFARALLTKRGAEHRKQRRLVQPVFQRQAVVSFSEAIYTHIERMLTDWATLSTFDISAEMDRFSERVLIRALLGERDKALIDRISEANHARRRFINHAFDAQFPFPQLLPTRRNREYRQASRNLAGIIRELVRDALTSDNHASSLLTRMAAAGGERSDGLNEDDLFEEVSELLTAGFETSREALTWSLYLLAKHPRCAARLRSEASQVAGQRAIRAEDTPELEYAAMFFSEALRLYPPAWMFVRVAAAEDTLPSGVRVEAGAKIFLCQYTAHRNPEYFPDPEHFRPERFDSRTPPQRPRFAYFPFGAGPRVCVAEALARLEGVLVLASVARRFDLELLPDQVIEPVGAITLRPKTPIRVAVRPVTARAGENACPTAERP